MQLRLQALAAIGRHFSSTAETCTSTVAGNLKSMDGHRQAVNEISATVRQFYEQRQKFRIFHGSTNSTRPKPGGSGSGAVVDTSRLAHVLKVDTATQTALVEPNVPMDRLVEETMRHGLVPPVVMEFPGITVGGGYAGTSGESSSFRHGFFDRTINHVEMVLANGEVVTCSDSDKPDLFHGAAGAVGTMGVTTLVELQLREAKKYVETTYHPVSSMSEALAKLDQATSNPEVDYVDGILFSKTQGAIITGRLTDSPQNDIKIQCFSHAWDPWFYLHVKDIITKRRKSGGAPSTVEAIPLAEYLFRYDRGGFWVGASAFSYFKMPFNRLTRWFLDDFLHTRMMYTALHASGQSKKYIVQDLALPYSTAEAFVDHTHHAFNIYPLWLCPLRQSPSPTMHPHSHEIVAEGAADGAPPKKPLMLNIGLWGFYNPTSISSSSTSNPTTPAADSFIAANRALELKLRDLGGMKWLYAHTYYPEDEFWTIYDRAWYDSLRAKYNATSSLPSVYEKVKVDLVENEKKGAAAAAAANDQPLWSALRTWVFNRIWPVSGLYGIWKAIQSGSYVQARKAAWKTPRRERERRMVCSEEFSEKID